MNFFKSFLASCLGSLVAFIVAFFLLFFLLAGLIGTAISDGGNNNKVAINDNSVLHLKLDVPITEAEIENPLEGLPLLGVSDPTIGLLRFKHVMQAAAGDPKIAGIYLDISMFMNGFATAKEIRESLLSFRKSGKWVVAYSEVMTETAYYIASAADKVYLNPEGDLEFNGLAVEVSFFKKLFDKLEIKPEIFRVGDFKSAVEPFMLDKMSDANRLQLNELIEGINNEMIKEVAASRNIEGSKLKEISDKMLASTLSEALQLKLVDSLVYFDQVLAELGNRLGVDDESDIDFVKYNKYEKTVSGYKTSENEIAVIVAEGDIMPGKADPGTIGSTTFAKELRKARSSKKVKPMVLRINSPGGSALASDVMWREVTLAAKEKPVIASMGDYAASGGYYLAMGANTIVAQPNTITGSIGVFSVLFDMSSFLGNKIGITFDEVKTGDVGELVTVTRPLTEQEKRIWQKRTDTIYDTFTSKAAVGRKMNVADLRKVASGRVWTGTQGKERGLVDELGGFDDAVKIAAEKAGIGTNYRIKYYPKQKTFFEQWLSDLEENAKTKMLRQELGENYPMIEQIKKVKSYQGTQARMPFELKIH
ncbi:MAG: signal peptide peptidase SppA [Cytophagales bacterium]